MEPTIKETVSNKVQGSGGPTCDYCGQPAKVLYPDIFQDTDTGASVQWICGFCVVGIGRATQIRVEDYLIENPDEDGNSSGERDFDRYLS